MDKIQQILHLKEKRNAIILAHYYQDPDIQDIADFMGDSLALAKYAQTVDADVILFCGVHFMSETAKILNPTKTVIIPDLDLVFVRLGLFEDEKSSENNEYSLTDNLKFFIKQIIKEFS